MDVCKRGRGEMAWWWYVVRVYLGRLFRLSLVVLVVGFVIYAYKLHSLAMEGNRIFAVRCTQVNPHLIAYKNAFLLFAGCINGTKICTNEEAVGAYRDYLREMETYVGEETAWLETQLAYSNRWDYKLIAPWYIQQAGYFQWKMYEAYRDDAKYISELPKGNISAEEIDEKVADARSRKGEYIDKYFGFFDLAVTFRDWRKIFGRVPVPAVCTEENTTFPDTSGAIDWGDEPEKPTIPANVDENTVG